MHSDPDLMIKGKTSSNIEYKEDQDIPRALLVGGANPDPDLCTVELFFRSNQSRPIPLAFQVAQNIGGLLVADQLIEAKVYVWYGPTTQPDLVRSGEQLFLKHWAGVVSARF